MQPRSGQATGKDYTNSTSTPEVSSFPHKNYMNYINFQGNSAMRDTQRQPDHVALYTLNANTKAASPNATTPINRNPYINGPVELRKDPPKQHLARNSSTKEQFACRQSQELIRNKTETLKSAHKSNSISSKGLNSNSLNSSMNKPSNHAGDFIAEFGSPNYNQTVDLGSISRNQSLAQSVVPEDQLLKQKIEYIEFLQQSLSDFQRHQDVRVLQNLNESNRLLLMKYFQEIGRMKDQRSRKTISDCISESDNFSEDNFSIDAKSDSRNTSLRIQGEKQSKFMDGFSKLREKSHEKQSELAVEMRLSERLEKEYQELTSGNTQATREMRKIEEEMVLIQAECNRLQVKNNEAKAKLNGFPFYQEWKLMTDEAEGAKKTEVRLKEELAKRRARLAEVKLGGNTQAQDYANRSQEPRSRQKPDASKQREGSVSKASANKPKIQPIPPAVRSLIPPSSEVQGNRVIQDSSLRIMGVSHQSRSKSINRSSN